MEKGTRERFWWVSWPWNMARHLLWPAMQVLWLAFPAIRAAAYSALGIAAALFLRLAWNRLWPEQPLGYLQAILGVSSGACLAVLVSKTGFAKGLTGSLSGLAIALFCIAWLVLAFLPLRIAHWLLAAADRPETAEKALGLYFGPVEWLDRKFFLSNRAGN